MKIYKGIDKFEARQNLVLTIGTFDGVHLGHRAIIDRINQIAKNRGGESVLLTFFPHPRKVLYGDDSVELLNTIDEKAELLEKEGLDHLIIYPFTREFSRMNALEYVRDIIVNGIDAKVVVVGYDHHFGRNREGGMNELNEFAQLYGFEVEEISAKEIDDVKVSSTKIREAIKKGEIALANEFLTEGYSFEGIVVKGDELGRKIGYPTANLNVNSDKILPEEGVFGVNLYIDQTPYKGMMNIGTRPTVNLKGEKRVEVNIFDFDQNIYGQMVRVEMIKKIRGEKKFDSLDELKAQIEKDKLMIINL